MRDTAGCHQQRDGDHWHVYAGRCPTEPGPGGAHTVKEDPDPVHRDQGPQFNTKSYWTLPNVWEHVEASGLTWRRARGRRCVLPVRSLAGFLRFPPQRSEHTCQVNLAGTDASCWGGRAPPEPLRSRTQTASELWGLWVPSADINIRY